MASCDHHHDDAIHVCYSILFLSQAPQEFSIRIMALLRDMLFWFHITLSFILNQHLLKTEYLCPLSSCYCYVSFFLFVGKEIHFIVLPFMNQTKMCFLRVASENRDKENSHTSDPDIHICIDWNAAYHDI